MIQGIRRLYLEKILRNAGNARSCLLLFEAIESSKFWEFPARRSCRGMLPSLPPVRTDRDVDCCFYNPFNSRFSGEGEATILHRGMDRRVPSGHSVE